MISILLGIFAIIGGLTGSFVLRGTDSSGALIVVGVVMIGRGIYQLAKRGGSSHAPAAPTREQTDYEREIQEAYDRAKGRKP